MFPAEFAHSMVKVKINCCHFDYLLIICDGILMTVNLFCPFSRDFVNFTITVKAPITTAAGNVFIISSPERKLRVSYCHHPMSVVRRQQLVC